MKHVGELIDFDSAVIEEIGARGMALAATPAMREAEARRDAAKRRSEIGARLDVAAVPTDPTVMPFVLDDAALRTEALVTVEDWLREYEAEPRGSVLCLGAAMGVGKTVGVCHPCVRAFDHSFLYRAASRMPNLYTDDGRALNERMEKTSILFLDDLELWSPTDKVLRPLLRYRFAYKKATIFAGNVTADHVMNVVFDDAMKSRVIEQARRGMRWFAPESRTPSNRRGDLCGPSMRLTAR